MAEELVRVRVTAGGRTEIVQVSGSQVLEYLKTHPESVVLPRDAEVFRAQQDAAEKDADKPKGAGR